MENDIFSSPFFSDGKAEILLKNQWKYLKEDGANPKEVHAGWGQGAALNYQSGFLADIFSVGFDYYSAMKLGASDYFNTRGVLYSKGSGYSKHNAGGYSKFGQRYIKLKGDVEDFSLNTQIGWQVLRNNGVITTSNRLSPTTYRGISGSIGYGELSLRGAYVERTMDRSSPDTVTLQTNDGRNINHIASGEVIYKTDAFTGQFAYGESHNYLRRQITQITAKPTKELSIDSQIYTTQAQDEYKSMALNRRNFDHNANHYAFDVKWNEPKWNVKLGIAHTRAPKSDGELGFYPRHMSKNSRGTFNSLAYAGDDYMRDGETMLGTIMEYHLTPEFTTGITGNYGQFDYKGVTVRTGEVNIFGRWAPSHPTLKNLTVFVMVGPGWSYKNNNKTPVLSGNDYQRAHTLGADFIAEYRFKLF